MVVANGQKPVDMIRTSIIQSCTTHVHVQHTHRHTKTHTNTKHTHTYTQTVCYNGVCLFTSYVYILSYKMKYWREYTLERHIEKYFGENNIGDLDTHILYIIGGLNIGDY